MGITGLLKFVEQATNYGHISKLKGATVAIDTFCLLHKGAYSCSDKIVNYQQKILILSITINEMYLGSRC